MAEKKLEETLSDLLADSPLPKDEVFDKIAVIGAGQMGLGIATAVSGKGIMVVLVEADDATLKRRQKRLDQILDAEIARWSMTESDKRAVLSRIQWTTDPSEIEGCKVVIEAVPDKMDIKKPLVERIDILSNPEAIIVTNTSTLSVTEIAECISNPTRVIGMHFLHPVPKRPLVEIVRGLKTSNETFTVAKSFAENIGKATVEVYESPGYVTTRLILPMLNEAMYALMEGVASTAGIDRAMREGYDFPAGPLELADRMGLDEVWQWLDRMFHETGEHKYRPCPLLRKYVRAGNLGAKTGQGFFVYDERGMRTKVAGPPVDRRRK